MKTNYFISTIVLSGAINMAFAETPTESSDYISFVESVPPMYGLLMRGNNYYGNVLDPNESGRSIYDRQFLAGNFGGYRDIWLDHGVLVGGGLTQTLSGAASGDGDSSKYVGSADVYLGLDTGRAKLWSGGLIFAHIEGSWGNSISGTGSVLPSNFDAVMPGTQPGDVALSEFYLMQGLPAGWAFTIGKINWTSVMETNMFANDERNQFMHTGLVNNAILGSFVPYTSLGMGLFRQHNEEVAYGFIYTSNSTNATSAGFDDLDIDEMTGGGQFSWSPKWDGKPGSYLMMAGYTNKDTINFHISEQHEFEEIAGIIPVDKKTGNWAVAVNMSQYLWVDNSASRADMQPVGFGIFARWGTAPKDRSAIDQFYSLGIAGTGGLFARHDDSWGIGWANSHFSKDLRIDLKRLGINIDRSENAYEAYYNVALTPAVKLTFDAQLLQSSVKSVDDPLVLGSRLQIDF